MVSSSASNSAWRPSADVMGTCRRIGGWWTRAGGLRPSISPPNSAGKVRVQCTSCWKIVCSRFGRSNLAVQVPFKPYQLRFAFLAINRGISARRNARDKKNSVVVVPILRFSESEMKDWREKKREKERENCQLRIYKPRRSLLMIRRSEIPDLSENLRIEAEKEIKLGSLLFN